MRGNTPELEGDATARRNYGTYYRAAGRLDEILTPILAPGIPMFRCLPGSIADRSLSVFIAAHSAGLPVASLR